MSDVEKGERAKLGFAVADELTEGWVHRGDVAVKARERHACLRLLEEDPEPCLRFLLGRFGPASITDVADQSQELVALGRDAMDRDLDRDARPRFGDDPGR